MTNGLPLFWRVSAINGLVFVVGTAALAFSPAKVSSQVLLSEAVVLAVGIAVILVTNSLLLRPSLSPLDRLTRLTERVDLLQPGQRLPETGNGNVSYVITAFNAMLERLETERGASSALALSAQEAERQRISQELHDEIGQSLTALLLGLKRAADRAPADLSEDVRALQEAARACLGEVRLVAQRLRPGVLDDLGLPSALAALASDVGEHSDVVLERHVDTPLPELPAEVELVLYRVAQEALTNTARHAGASRVQLSLTVQDERLTLCVADDGVGAADPSEGAGIRGMRERALLIGAELTVGSRPGEGTVVRLVVPVAPVTPPAEPPVPPAALPAEVPA